MDDLDQREAFLKAIFAAPDDDLPRLVFADWLDERGDAEWAELIRIQCELSRMEKPFGIRPPTRWHELREREQALLCDTPRFRLTNDVSVRFAHRGFVEDDTIGVPVFLLTDPESFRRTAIAEHPEWYGTSRLTATSGLIASSKSISTILNSPVTQKVTRLDLSGSVIETVDPDGLDVVTGARTGEFELRLTDFTYRPTVTLQAVEALVNARECRRFTHIDLRNNDLDNDAARAILRSTNLTRLQSLHLFDGNRLRGRTWAQLIDRFGEEVVS